MLPLNRTVRMCLVRDITRTTLEHVFSVSLRGTRHQDLNSKHLLLLLFVFYTFILVPHSRTITLTENALIFVLSNNVYNLLCELLHFNKLTDFMIKKLL